MLLIALTCTDKDYGVNLRNISESFSNFYSCFASDVFFLVIYQSTCHKSIAPFVVDGVPSSSILVNCVDYLSVSRARNDALDFARENNFDSIIFHDASLIFTPEYLQFLKSRLGNHLLSGE